jgi:hypothetical protein
MKVFLIIVAILLILIPGIHLIIYQFNHVDMTNTRIFLNNWQWYIPILIGLIILAVLNVYDE